MRRKNVPASTIHGLIYQSIGTTLQKDGREPREVPRFRRRSPEALRHFSHIIIDEASMVPRRIHDDLLSFGKPIIYVGDHGQLPPVRGTPFNLMSAPHVTLETIYRNSGEIVKFAHFLRSGERPSAWERHPDATGEGVEFVDRKWLKTADPSQGEQVITAFNDDRIDLNRRIRRSVGYESTDGVRPVAGERLICLQNNHGFGVFNGMMGDVTAIDAETLTFRSAGVDFTVPYAPEKFGNAQEVEYRKDKCVFDFAYAITCHKAQGDEWPTVMVAEPGPCRAWDHARWAYTAASRAKTKLYWVSA